MDHLKLLGYDPKEIEQVMLGDFRVGDLVEIDRTRSDDWCVTGKIIGWMDDPFDGVNFLIQTDKGRIPVARRQCRLIECPVCEYPQPPMDRKARMKPHGSVITGKCSGVR